jgi:tetratricopeptide (TPR) repeat protein
MAAKRRDKSRDPQTRERRGRFSGWGPYALVALASLVAMGPLLGAEFLSWDDYDTIARNPHFNPPSFEGLAYYWGHAHMHLYAPLTYTAWWALASLAHVFGGGPPMSAAWFHGANLLLHVLAGVVVFRLLELLVKNRVAGLIGALLFSVHPMQVEAVGWASGLKDVLCGLLIWTAVWQYLEFARASPPDARRWRNYAWATAAFVAAMLAKPTAVVTPLLVVAVDRLICGRPWREILRSAGPWFLLTIPCVLWTARVQPPSAETPQVAAALRPLVALDALAFYVQKLFWPFDLAVDQGRRPDVVVANGSAYWTWVVPAVAAAVFLGLAWRERRREPGRAAALVLAAIIPLVCLGPVLGLRPFDFQQYSTAAEHYFYPAMVGPALLAALLLAWRGGRPAWRGAAGVVLVLLAVRSHLQAYTWKDNGTLFAHALAVNPKSLGSYNSLAAWYAETGQADRAIETARRWMALDPKNPRPWATMSSALVSKRDLPGAIKAARKGVEVAPDHALAHSNLAGLLGQAGDFAAAQREAEEALRLDPNDANAHLNLGTMFAQQDKTEQAFEHLRAAVRLSPASAVAHTNLGFLLLGQGNRQEAAEHFEAALHANPKFENAKHGLAQARGTPR